MQKGKLKHEQNQNKKQKKHIPKKKENGVKKDRKLLKGLLNEKKSLNEMDSESSGSYKSLSETNSECDKCMTFCTQFKNAHLLKASYES